MSYTASVEAALPAEQAVACADYLYPTRVDLQSNGNC